MEDKRMMMSGFSPVQENEMYVRGGLNPETLKKIAKILGILVDIIASYGEDFYKGYKKALEGKPLYALTQVGG